MGCVIWYVMYLPSLESNQRFDDIVFLGHHHLERTLDLREGEPMRRQWCRINAARFQEAQQAHHPFSPSRTQRSANLFVAHAETKLR